MKKKGFTLIELLAVIVILAIIALIAIPQLTKLVENAKIGAVKNSVYGMMEAGELSYIYNEEDVEDGQLTYTCDGKSCKTESGSVLKFKGRVPDSGSITVNKDKEDEADFVQFGEYCAYGSKDVMQVWKGKCELTPGLYDDDMNLVMSYEELQKKYKLNVSRDFRTKNYSGGITLYYNEDNDTYYNKTGLPNSLYYALNNSGDELKKATTFVFPTNSGVGDYSLYRCTQIKNVILPRNLTSIGLAALAYTSIESIVIPNSVKSFEGSVFDNCTKLKKVKLPRNLREIDGFGNCYELKSIKLPSDVKVIRSHAFDGSGIKNIELPDTVEKIEHYAFKGCSLEKINIPSSLKSIDTEAFQFTKISKVIFNNNISKIGERAFQYSGLEEIYIPKGLVDIKSGAFNGCKNLKTIVIDKENPTYYDGGINAIIERNTKKILVGTNETIPSDILEIGNSAYYNNQFIKKIIIPDSVKKIGGHAFFGVKSLKTLIIGKNVEEIGNEAFYETTIENNVVIPKNVKEIGSTVFGHNYKFKEVTFEDPNNWHFGQWYCPSSGCYEDEKSIVNVTFDDAKNNLKLMNKYSSYILKKND